MLIKDLNIQARQSGKTKSLKERAIHFYKAGVPVTYITPNVQQRNNIKKYFKNAGYNIKCISINEFNIRENIIKNPYQNSPEYKIIGMCYTEIILDEYKMMNTELLNDMFMDLEMSSINFRIYGMSSNY